MAAAKKPTIATTNEKIDKVLDALESVGLDVGAIGNVIRPASSQPVVVQTPASQDNNSQWLLIGGAVLLALVYFKK